MHGVIMKCTYIKTDTVITGQKLNQNIQCPLIKIQMLGLNMKLPNTLHMRPGFQNYLHKVLEM